MITVGSEGLGRERPSKENSGKAGSKHPEVLGKGHAVSETSSPRKYRSMLGPKDVTYIHVLYGVLEEFELDLPGPDTRVNNPPLG